MLAPLALHRVVAARCLLSVTGAVPVPVELPKFLLFFFVFFFFQLQMPCESCLLEAGSEEGSELRMDGARCLGALASRAAL